MATDSDYESVILVKPEVFVYRIPPRQTNRGFRAADWNLEQADWTGRLRMITKGKKLSIRLEDKNSGELFASCPIESYPGPSVESVSDSSRYFVIRIQDETTGKTAFIGVGFADRSDSFDLNVALQDHFKWLKQSEDFAKQDKELDKQPKLDLSFKEGQTITINLGNKLPKSPKPRQPMVHSNIGVLPPPPGGKIPLFTPPPSPSQQQHTSVGQTTTTTTTTHSTTMYQPSQSEMLGDLLGDIGPPPTFQPQQQQQQTNQNIPSDWGDFIGSSGNTIENNANPSSSGWVTF